MAPKSFIVMLIAFSIFTTAFNTHAETTTQTAQDLLDIKLERSVLSLATLDKNFPFQTYFKPDEILEWRIHLPLEYSPTRSYGLLVFVSSQNSGSIPDMWKPLLADKNLIWISAENAGNDMPPQRRVIQTLFAVQLARQFYDINSKRIYLSGFSGGSRVASMMAPLYPSLFPGSIFMCGTNEFKIDKKLLPKLQSNRFAFINGEKDFNLAESKKVFRKLKQQGIDQVEFFEVPNLEHHFPPAQSLAAAIDFLDKKDASTLSTPH